MSLLERSLARLTLTGYTDRDLKHRVGSLKAMYNPDSVQLGYTTEYTANQFINSSIQSNNYAVTRPGNLSLELVFDNRMPGNDEKVEEQLKKLRHLCYDLNPSRGEPHFLRIQWGKMRWAEHGYFAGRMTSLSFRYTLFDRDAMPLRATASLTIAADQSLAQQRSMQQLQSPPTLVLRVPAGGGGLSLMAFGASAFVAGGTNYLDLAISNDLDNLHAIAPGQTLAAPAEGGAAP